MQLHINGETHIFEDDKDLSISTLIEHFELQLSATVVELNGNILDKTLFDTTLAKDKDRIELVRFVGGG